MRCAWREIASFVDPWHMPVFFAAIVTILVLFLWGTSLLHVFGVNLWS